MDTIIKKSLSATIAIAMVVASSYIALEPTVSDAVSDTINVSLSVSSQLTLSTESDTTFSRALDLTASTAVATVAWNVISNDDDGYTLQVKNASTAPALRNVIDASEGHFADYTPTTPGVPETWSVPSGSKEFGFSAFGTDTTGYGTDTDCIEGDAHTPSAGLDYLDLPTTNVTIASSSGTTTLVGTTTNVCFAVEQDDIFAADGTYVAEVTATATTN